MGKNKEKVRIVLFDILEFDEVLAPPLGELARP